MVKPALSHHRHVHSAAPALGKESYGLLGNAIPRRIEGRLNIAKDEELGYTVPHAVNSDTKRADLLPKGSRYVTGSELRGSVCM